MDTAFVERLEKAVQELRANLNVDIRKAVKAEFEARGHQNPLPPTPTDFAQGLIGPPWGSVVQSAVAAEVAAAQAA